MADTGAVNGAPAGKGKGKGAVGDAQAPTNVIGPAQQASLRSVPACHVHFSRLHLLVLYTFCLTAHAESPALAPSHISP